MNEKTKSMPSLAVQISLAVFTSLTGCALLFVFGWQRQLPPIEALGLSVPASLSLLVLLGLVFTVILLISLRRLPEFGRAGGIIPERRMKIIRILRADAYTYLLLPILVMLTLAWRQIGNAWLLWVIILILLLVAKCLILIEIKRLDQKSRSDVLF